MAFDSRQGNLLGLKSVRDYDFLTVTPLIISETCEERLVSWSWGQELQKVGEVVTSNTGFRVLTGEWIKAYMHVTGNWGWDLEFSSVWQLSSDQYNLLSVASYLN